MLSFLLSLLVFLGTFGGTFGAPSGFQVPIVEAEDDIFHVGMDLSVSYGAVAIGFSKNDTIISVGRVEGSEEYKSLMSELGWQESWEPVGPWIPVDPRHTAILSKMITALKTRAEQYLGVKINSTLVASAALPYLYVQTLHASILAADLEDLDDTHERSIGASFKQPQAVMAGSNVGICHDWWNKTACHEEIGSWPRENPITILYTSNALCVSRGDCKGAYGYTSSHSYPSSMDFTLGYDERDRNPDAKYYWEAVRDRIIKGTIGSSSVPWRNPTVWVHGDYDAVNDLEFHRTVKRAIADIIPGKPPIYFSEDPVYVAAKGAARILREGNYRG